MLNNLNHREKVLLLVIITVVLAAGFYLFLFRPQMEAYSSAREQLKVKQERLRQDEAALRSGKIEAAKAEQVKKQLAEYKCFFDTDFMHGSALILLSFKAMDLNISITNLEPGGILNRGNYLELPVKLNLTGGYHSMLLFLSELENLPNLAEIQSLKIILSSHSPGSVPATGVDAAPNAGDATVDARCELVIYSNLTPGSILSLEQQKTLAWQTGRENLFTTPVPVSPHPEVPQPLLNQETESIEQDDRPLAPDPYPAPGNDTERGESGEDSGTGEMDGKTYTMGDFFRLIFEFTTILKCPVYITRNSRLKV